MQSNQIPDWLLEETESDQRVLATGVYQELRQIAAKLMSGEREGHTLQATDLVHEAYLSLRAKVGQDLPAEDRHARFLFYAARVMRRLLVDHARARGALKRGGDAQRITLQELTLHLPHVTTDLCEVDAALERLARRDPRKAKIVELRFFTGCSIRETAEVLGISEATVEREWKFSKAWLAAELAPSSEAQ